MGFGELFCVAEQNMYGGGVTRLERQIVARL